MANVKPHGAGIVLLDKVYFGTEDADFPLVLRPQTGESMTYDRSTSIDFPGEFERSGVFTSVWADQGGQLNYSIDFGNKVYTIVQSRSYLKSEECPDDAAKWIFVGDGLLSVAEKNGYEGSYVDISGDERAEGKMGVPTE